MAIFSWGWDTGYESIPSDSLNRALIDDALRNMRKGVRERMEPEHNWGPYVEKDDGSHRGGYTTVCGKGNAAARGAISGMRDGSLFLLDVGGVLTLCVYLVGTGWVEISALDHGLLTNLGLDSHTQYLLKAGGAMTGNLEMGGQNIKMATIAESQGGFVQHKHRNMDHLGLGNKSAISDAEIGRAKIKWFGEQHSGDIDDYGYYLITPPSAGFVLCPNFSCDMFDGSRLYLGFRPDKRWQIQNQDKYNGDFRFNFRYFTAAV